MRFTAIIASMGLVLLAGCEAEQNVPSAAQFSEERGKLQDRVAARKAKGAAKPAKPVQVASADPSENAFAGDGTSFEYDRTDKRDPFRSFEWERLALEESEGGPLEQFDVSQLSVVAVVWNPDGGRALVEDPSGQNYIVQMGTRIGKNDGSVVRIGDNLVVVKETYVDFLGHESRKDVEMRIRTSEGG